MCAENRLSFDINFELSPCILLIFTFSLPKNVSIDPVNVGGTQSLNFCGATRLA